MGAAAFDERLTAGGLPAVDFFAGVDFFAMRKTPTLWDPSEANRDETARVDYDLPFGNGAATACPRHCEAIAQLDYRTAIDRQSRPRPSSVSIAEIESDRKLRGQGTPAGMIGMTDDPPMEADDLSLQDMLRVMDVARTLRKERETVSREFSRDEQRSLLRTRLLQTTAITGEPLTDADVEAALDLYFDNLHTFRPPPPGLSTLLAYAWVERRTVAVGLLLLGLSTGLVWWMWPQAVDPLTEAFEVRIVSGTGQQSGIDRYFTDDAGTRAPAFYVIVQAMTPDGQLLSRPIRNAETGQWETVSTWAERVPADVYERIRADKQADGVLDETLFAVKRPGSIDWDMVLRGPDGQPIARGSQLTRW